MSESVSRTVAAQWFKPALAALLIAASASPLAAQGTAKKAEGKMEGMDHSKMEMMEPATGWKELDAFHTLLAATFHPAQGKNDLAPIKAKAADLSAAAQKWKASTAPKGCDSPKIRDAIVKIAAGSQNVAAMVAKGTDDATLKKSLGDVHEAFEPVEMGCKPVKRVAK